jgi:hypothetical protein
VTRWIAIGAIVAAVWLAKFPDVASAQELPSGTKSPSGGAGKLKACGLMPLWLVPMSAATSLENAKQQTLPLVKGLYAVRNIRFRHPPRSGVEFRGA